MEGRGGVEVEGTLADNYGYICIIKRQIIEEKEDQGYMYHGEISSIRAHGLFFFTTRNRFHSVSRGALRLDNLAGWSEGLIRLGRYPCTLTLWLWRFEGSLKVLSQFGHLCGCSPVLWEGDSEPRVNDKAALESVIGRNYTHWRVSCVSSVPLLANPLLQNLHMLFLESETSLGAQNVKRMVGPDDEGSLLELQVHSTDMSADHVAPSFVATKARFPSCIRVVLQQEHTPRLVPV